MTLGRVRQVALEILTEGPAAARVRQAALEVIIHVPDPIITKGRVRQAAVEVIERIPSTTGRVRQAVIELALLPGAEPVFIPPVNCSIKINAAPLPGLQCSINIGKRTEDANLCEEINKS